MRLELDKVRFVADRADVTFFVYPNDDELGAMGSFSVEVSELNIKAKSVREIEVLGIQEIVKRFGIELSSIVIVDKNGIPS